MPPYMPGLRRKRDLMPRRRARQLMAPQPDNYMSTMEAPSLRRHPFARKMGDRGNQLGKFRPQRPRIGPPETGAFQIPRRRKRDQLGEFEPRRPIIDDPRFPGLPPPPPIDETPLDRAKREAQESIDRLGLPLSPEFEMQRRSLEDSLAQTLAAVGVARDQIPALLRLVTERLGTEQGESERRTNEGAEARGIYDSTIRQEDLGKVRTGYDRQRQDLATDSARQYSDLASQESGALTGYSSGIAELLLQLAQSSAADPNAPTERPRRRRRKKGKK